MQKKRVEKLILYIFMFLPIFTISTYLDNDSWFLLNHGKYILENGFPTIEPFTIHENLQFMIQQWLFDIGYWIVYSKLGKVSVLVCLYVIAIIVTLLIYELCMQITENKFYISVVITVFTSLFVCAWYIVSRPQSLTYIIILVELLCLEKYISTNKKHWLAILPILSVFEINFHASMWVLLFAFWLPYMVESFTIKIVFIKNEGAKKIPLIITAIGMLGAGLLNPYGIDAVLYITKSYGDKTINESVNEMLAPTIRNIPGLAFFIILSVVILVYVLNKTGETKLRYILLLMGTTLLTLLSQKSMPYFLIGSVIPLGYNLKNHEHQLTFGGENKEKNAWLYGGCLAFLFLVIIVAISTLIKKNDKSGDYPICKDAVEFLDANYDTKDVTLYANYFDGGYAEYCGFKSYIDARAEVFLKKNNGQKDIFEEYIDLQSGEIYYKEFLEEYGFSHIMVSNADILSIYLKYDENYKIIYEDSEYKIYIPISTMEVKDE